MACFLHELPIIVVPRPIQKSFPAHLSDFRTPAGGFDEKSALSAGCGVCGSRATVIDDHQDMSV